MTTSMVWQTLQPMTCTHCFKRVGMSTNLDRCTRPALLLSWSICPNSSRRCPTLPTPISFRWFSHNWARIFPLTMSWSRNACWEWAWVYVDMCVQVQATCFNWLMTELFSQQYTSSWIQHVPPSWVLTLQGPDLCSKHTRTVPFGNTVNDIHDHLEARHLGVKAWDWIDLYAGSP